MSLSLREFKGSWLFGTLSFIKTLKVYFYLSNPLHAYFFATTKKPKPCSKCPYTPSNTCKNCYGMSCLFSLLKRVNWVLIFFSSSSNFEMFYHHFCEFLFILIPLPITLFNTHRVFYKYIFYAFSCRMEVGVVGSM